MSIDDVMKKLTFNSDGHIPAIIQDGPTRQVLTLCYMTPDALKKTLEERYVYVFRRSLNKLMKKGETSGHVQELLSVRPDCDGKSLLVEVKQHVAGCHRGYFTCYFEELNAEGGLTVKEEKVFDPDKIYKKGK